jgi:hypothetical protein
MPEMNLPEVMVLHVTEDHIQQGTPQDEHDCPIARAMFEFVHGLALDWTNWEELEDYPLPDVLEDEAEIAGTLYAVPPEARAWMDNFDHERPVQPATFTLTKIHLTVMPRP